jgi:hypothetical protein
MRTEMDMRFTILIKADGKVVQRHAGGVGG